MSEKRKGFTLIELLAAIVIMVVIALIAVPTVMNIIANASKAAFKDSAYGIIKAGEMYYASKDMKGEILEETSFIFPNYIKGLDIKGSIPTSGIMMVNETGDVSIAVSNERWCAKKKYLEKDITLEEIEETCDIGYEVLVQDLEVSTENTIVNVGETKNLEVKIIPASSTNKELEYKSNDESIVTVDEYGNITGIKAGITTINVRAMDGTEKEKEIVITVLQKALLLELDTDSVSVMKGSVFEVKGAVLPEDTSDKGLKWTSIDEEIATVKEGIIRGVSVGETIVRAETIDGSNLSTSVKVTVRQPVEILELDKYEVTLTKTASDENPTETVTATVTPDNAYIKGIKWGSSDESVATVVNGVITAVGKGTTTITAETTDGSNLSETVAVTVVQKVTSITVSPTNVTIKKGASTTVKATPSPTNANNTAVTWTSGNASIATVMAAGVVKGVAVGSTTITVKSNDGGASKTFNVTVQAATNPNITTTNTCLESGTCKAGTALTVKVNSSTSYNFYVISDDGSTLTLIMNKNLGTTVKWNSTGDTCYGPRAALDYLESLTSGWTSIDAMTYSLTYCNTTTVTRTNVRARLITKTEAANLGCGTDSNGNESGTCPDFLNTNLGKNDGYWTSSRAGSKEAYRMVYDGRLNTPSINNYTYGVRPVIKISKKG